MPNTQGTTDPEDAEWLRPKCQCGRDCHAEIASLRAELEEAQDLVKRSAVQGERLMRQRDALRAENQRLRQAWQDLFPLSDAQALQRDAALRPNPEGECPFTHSHTREWCGYEQCREA